MTAASQNLHVERAGVGDPVVLLHGLGASWVSWSQVLPALTPYVEVLAPDLPGHGRSAPLPPGTAPTVEALTDSVERELDRLGINWPVPIVGNSLGGEVALELAVRSRAGAVLALSPSGLSTSWERVYIRNTLRAGHQLARVIVPWADDLGANPVARSALFGLIRSRPWRMTAQEAATEVRNMASPAFLDTLLEVEARTADNLDKIDCPVTVGFGTFDRLLGAHQGPRFAAAIRDARLVRLPGLGHVPMSDDPEAVARLAHEFLAGS